MKAVIKRLSLTLATLYMLTVGCLASAQQVRSVAVEFNLETASDISLPIEVTVRNHTVVVVPPNFTIIRPIISSVTQTLTLPANQTRIALRFSNVSTEAVNYSIRIRCLACDDEFPTQYYLLRNGQARSTRALIDDAYLSPSELDNLAPIDIETFAVLSGTINLRSGRFAPRIVRARLQVTDAQTGRLLDVNGLVTLKSDDVTGFRLNRIDRRFVNQFNLSLKCTQCERKQYRFNRQLSATENHTNLKIDALLGPPNLPWLSLLLDD